MDSTVRHLDHLEDIDKLQDTHWGFSVLGDAFVVDLSLGYETSARYLELRDDAKDDLAVATAYHLTDLRCPGLYVQLGCQLLDVGG
ncbi:hypothetical protein D3C86_1914460 [compost metagenome]